jgi:hypothetical protein
MSEGKPRRRATVLERRVVFEMTPIDFRVNATSTTPSFALESLGSPLHLPAPIPAIVPHDSRLFFVAVPVPILLSVVNNRQTPLLEPELRIDVFDDKENNFQTEKNPPIETIAGQCTFCRIQWLTIARSGQFTIRADLQSKTDKARVKDVFTFEDPLTVIHRIKIAKRQLCEITVANDKLERPITNLRVAFSDTVIGIADVLRPDERASGFIQFDELPSSMLVLWELRGLPNCAQQIPLREGAAVRAAPITLKVTNIPKSVRCLEPFEATIVLQNNEKLSLSGEVAIRNGPILLWGLNKLQFVDLGPGGSADLKGNFVAVEEGKLVFPPFVIGVTGALQLECDAKTGVFVIDRIE